MKKKVLSALLAVSMFVGMAVPAFASTVSSLAGDSSDVDKIVFTKDSFTVKQNDELKILNADHPDKNIVKAFVGKDTFVPDADLEFELDCPDGSFALSGDSVYALEKSGKATLKAISDDNEKVFATTKLVATTGTKDSDKNARGFKFETKSYKVPCMAPGTVATQETTPAAFEFKIKSVPADAKFSTAQRTKISSFLRSELASKLSLSLPTDFDKECAQFEDDGKTIKYTIDSAIFDGKLAPNDEEKEEINIDIPDFNDGKDASASCNMTLVEGKVARNVSVPSKIDIQVGDTYDLSAALKKVPSTANILFKNALSDKKGNSKKGISYDEDYLNEAAEYSDYAIVDDGGMITAIAVGKNKIVTTYNYVDDEGNFQETEAVTIVNVVPLGTKVPSDASVTPTTGAIKVGEKMTITAKNVGNSEVNWSVSNGKLATVTMKGASTTVKAVAPGSVTVTAKVGDKVIGSAKITITAGGKPIIDPVKPGNITNNPPTGDSLFSNLF